MDVPVVRCKAPGCGLPLRSPTSRALGYGTVCYERTFPRAPRPRKLFGEKVSPARGRDHSPQSGPDLLDELEQQP